MNDQPSPSSPARASVPEAPLRSPGRQRRGRMWLGVSAGLLVGLLAGVAGVHWAWAAPDPEAPSITEELYLEYALDNGNGNVRWADWTSAPDTYLAVRLQSEPEKVYVTPVVPDNPGFARPCRVAVPRALLPGERAYVYVMDDDSWSDRQWKLIARTALAEGGSVTGKMVSTWTLGQVPDRVVVALFDRAGDAVAELTLDADDCLASAVVPLHSQTLDFQAQEDESSLPIKDRADKSAGTLRVVFGHRN